MQRGRATGDDALHEFGRCAESRWNFAGIENAETSTATGADVKQTAAFAHRLSNELNRAGKIDNRGVQRFSDKFLFVDEQLHKILRLHSVEVFRTRIALLSQRRGQVVYFFRRCFRVNFRPAVHFRGQPSRAKFRGPLRIRHPRIGQRFFQTPSKCMIVNRVALKKSAEQDHFRCKHVKSGRNRFSVFAKKARTFFDDFHHA